MKILSRLFSRARRVVDESLAYHYGRRLEQVIAGVTGNDGRVYIEHVGDSRYRYQAYGADRKFLTGVVLDLQGPAIRREVVLTHVARLIVQQYLEALGDKRMRERSANVPSNVEFERLCRQGEFYGVDPAVDDEKAGLTD